MSTVAPQLHGIEKVEGAGRSWHVATLVAVVGAVASLAVAIIALNHASSARTSNTAQLSSEVRSLKAELAAARAEGKAALSKDGAAISKITTCLPELSGELNGLTVETGYREIGSERYLTNAYLKQGKALSSYCQ